MGSGEVDGRIRSAVDQPWYQVNEIFESIQGEGVLAGLPSTFIRLQGCPVGCSWCDTKYTWAKGGSRMDISDILSKVTQKHVVVTGGEPTLWNLDSLLDILHFEGCTTQLETSGLKELKGITRPDHVTWSPKENLKYRAPKSIMKMAKEVKWVVDENLELSTILETWQDMIPINPDIVFVFMPEGCPPSQGMINKSLAWLYKAPANAHNHWLYGDRLQWRLNVK